jgi:hypothetical protein
VAWKWCDVVWGVVVERGPAACLALEEGFPYYPYPSEISSHRGENLPSPPSEPTFKKHKITFTETTTQKTTAYKYHVIFITCKVSPRLSPLSPLSPPLQTQHSTSSRSFDPPQHFSLRPFLLPRDRQAGPLVHESETDIFISTPES